jgi:uncharacterized membrane-anchored protein
MRVTNITVGLMICAAFLAPAFADEPEAPAAAAAEPPTPTFQFTTGDVTLPNKVATLHLGEKYHYLSPSEASKLLQAWGNPADESTQGAVLPADVNPLTEEGWAVFLTYKKDGHVDDSDAAKIDYEDLLKNMKEGTEDSNEARKESGFPPMHIVGWAEPPRYDRSSKRLYWAKELKQDNGSPNSLNYDVRVLGREGVLSMQAVSFMNQAQKIIADMRPLVEVAEFNEGYRYAEFNSKTDKLAEYGLGGLIVAGVAAKLGLFGKLFAMLLAFKKVILVGIVAVGGAIAKLFKKKDATT